MSIALTLLTDHLKYTDMEWNDDQTRVTPRLPVIDP